MQTTRFDVLARALDEARSRRGLFGLIAGSSVTWLGLADANAKKKRKKHKKKKKCGKNGSKPVKDKCCTGSVRVGGRCRACDVCQSGCAFTSVQEAINVASDGETIVVCPGTYEEGQITIAKYLRLVGAGDGGGATGTTLQGSTLQGTGPVVLVQGRTITLENLRITGFEGAKDAAVDHDTGTLELIGCTVNGNTGLKFGGGIVNRVGSTLTLRNSTVSENGAENGGGIFNAGALHLINSTIGENNAASGGGIYNDSGTLTADTASRVMGNEAGMTGGGMYNNGTVTLASSAIVTGNTPNNCAGTAAVPMCNG